jgi:hypothetical protein
VWQGTLQERVDSIAASPRAYLVRRPAKNVISPPPLKKKQQCKIVQRARAPRSAHTTNIYISKLD